MNLFHLHLHPNVLSGQEFIAHRIPDHVKKFVRLNPSLFATLYDSTG